MDKPTFDPGLTQQFGAPLRRIINKDGTFNVRRQGVTWKDIHPYLYLINMSWAGYLTVVFFAYLVANTIFALAYFTIPGVELKGADATTDMGRFLETFFFSAQTLTTVGYGGISPHGVPANVLSSLESMVGVLGFALATGLLFGRVSKPSARIGFSEKMALAPYRGGYSLQFRIVNKRLNSLMDLDAKMMLMTVDGATGRERKRTYQMLKLERHSVYFFPLTWTVVHPITEDSPLHGKTFEDLEKLQAEVLILVKGYDDTFSQTVHARYSYRYDEIEWRARFAPAFYVDEAGDLVLEVNRVGALVLEDSANAA
jgi:inward rectifier potassium channel